VGSRRDLSWNPGLSMHFQDAGHEPINSGAPACDRLHPIIFGRSQILPSRPLFTVALINLFTLK
jgi:hypothetical protein